MSDRQQDSSITIYADLPTTGLTGTVALTDALGASAAASTAFSEVGLNRYKCTLTITTTETILGLWKAAWTYAGAKSGTYTQQLTIGEDQGSVKWDIRFHAARRASEEAYLGFVTSSTTTTIVDNALIGGDDQYVGQWIVLDDSEDQWGIFRRVTAYNSTTHALTLDTAYAVAPTAGSRYLMLDATLRPERIDLAMQGLIETLTDKAYVRVRVTGRVPDSNHFVALPDGWSHVTRVDFLDSTTNVWSNLIPASFACVPGQKLYMPASTTNWTVNVEGLRKARVPLFDDSRVDIAESVLASGIAYTLHLDNAGGQATDFEAHLQRANQQLQEHGLRLSIDLPRLANNAKRVIL